MQANQETKQQETELIVRIKSSPIAMSLDAEIFSQIQSEIIKELKTLLKM